MFSSPNNTFTESSYTPIFASSLTSLSLYVSYLIHLINTCFRSSSGPHDSQLLSFCILILCRYKFVLICPLLMRASIRFALFYIFSLVLLFYLSYVLALQYTSFPCIHNIHFPLLEPFLLKPII